MTDEAREKAIRECAFEVPVGDNGMGLDSITRDMACAFGFDAGVAHATQWVRISESGYPKRSGMYRVTLSDGTLGQSAFYCGGFDRDVIGWLPEVKIEPMPLPPCDIDGGEK